MAQTSHHSIAQVTAPAAALLKLIEQSCNDTTPPVQKTQDRLPPCLGMVTPVVGQKSGDLSESKATFGPVYGSPPAGNDSPANKNFDFCALYDPESPWGVLGITYDPASPQWAWRPLRASTEPVNPTAPKQANSLPTSRDTSFVHRHHASKKRPLANPEVPKWGPGLTSFFGNNDLINSRFVLASENAPAVHRGVKRGHPTKKNRPVKSQQQPVPKPVHNGASVVPWARCCPVEVPSILHMILDRTGDKLDPHLIEQYVAHVGKLCPEHLQKYQRLKASMVQRPVDSSRHAAPEAGTRPDTHVDAAPLLATSCTTPCPLPSSPMPVPSTQQAKHKRRRVPGDSHRGTRTPRAVDRSDIRPVANVIRDSWYRKQVMKELQETFSQANGIEMTHGGVTNHVVYNLLSVAKQPNVSADRGPLDARFLTGDEARDLLDTGSPGEPIITEKEQMFKWHPRLRPIEELFRRMENLDRSVSVQVPSRNCMEDSFESRDLTQVRNRFLSNEGTNDPWNILDLRSPLPAAVLPRFLTCENCQLLPRLRDEVLNPSRAERGTATREQWNEWRDVLEWVLLSQGGHNTSPHTDSHGLGTWITVQEGLFGYGWMSHPTKEEHDQWMADPHGFTGGRWCYVILEPGQTVFFNSGTVHFVFRLRNEHTLALGGHVLQWSGIECWLQIVEAQMNNPHITNEDMEWSAPKYVRVVARLVEARLRNGRVDEMGGTEAVCRLLRLLKEFDDTYIKGRSHKSRPKKKRYR